MKSVGFLNWFEIFLYLLDAFLVKEPVCSTYYAKHAKFAKILSPSLLFAKFLLPMDGCVDWCLCTLHINNILKVLWHIQSGWPWKYEVICSRPRQVSTSKYHDYTEVDIFKNNKNYESSKIRILHILWKF